MKKLGLVMVFVILITFFIGFNYLLWDRDSKMKELSNLESLNMGKNVSINAQNKEIQKLEEEKAELESTVDTYKTANSNLLKEQAKLIDDRSLMTNDLSRTKRMIEILKQSTDVELVVKPVSDWVAAINAKNYGAAYVLEFEGLSPEAYKESLDAYSAELSENIESISIVSAAIDKEKGSQEGYVFLDVVLNVKPKEGGNPMLAGYSAGDNRKLIRIDAGRSVDELIIGSIEDYEQQPVGS